MFIVKEGYPFIIASLVVAAIVYFLFGAYWAVIPVVLAVYFAYFFRDFHRSMPYDPSIALHFYFKTFHTPFFVPSLSMKP